MITLCVTSPLIGKCRIHTIQSMNSASDIKFVSNDWDLCTARTDGDINCGIYINNMIIVMVMQYSKLDNRLTHDQ